VLWLSRPSRRRAAVEAKRSADIVAHKQTDGRGDGGRADEISRWRHPDAVPVSSFLSSCELYPALAVHVSSWAISWLLHKKHTSGLNAHNAFKVITTSGQEPVGRGKDHQARRGRNNVQCASKQVRAGGSEEQTGGWKRATIQDLHLKVLHTGGGCKGIKHWHRSASLLPL
jgi:hypothetical protein